MNKLDPVFNHEIYDYMAQQPLNSAQMRLWWDGMGNYCKPTRNPGQWLRALPATHKATKEALMKVFESESGHEKTLAIMAQHLIERCEVRVELAAKISQEKRQIAPPLQAFKNLLAKRESKNTIDTPHNLGTMLGIERLANQNIIPGEVKAFIDSKHYRVKLSDPEMHYLEEHYGELGAESWHQATLERISKTLGRDDEILIAEQAIYKTTETFYEAMLQGLKALK